MKYLKWIGIGALTVLCLCLLFRACTSSADIAYQRGRTKQIEAMLKLTRKQHEKVRAVDEKLQKEKDKELVELRKDAAERRERIVVIDEEIAATPVPEVAKPIVALYKGKVVELEAIIVDKDKQLKVWEEKFNSKVEKVIASYVKELAEERVLVKQLKKELSVTRAKVIKLKFGGTLFKVLAYGFGGYTAYDVFLRRK